MKKINIFILTMVLVFSITTSCKKDDHKDFSTLVKSTTTELQILGVPSALIVREDTADVIATITLSLSEPQIVDVHVPIKQISGDASQGDDYELSTSEIVFPAYTTGPQTFTVTILDDNIKESDETFTLQIGDDLTSNTIFTPKTMEVTITNATDLDLNMSFDWSKNYLLHYWTITGGDTTINTANAVDLDIYVFDEFGSAGGNDLGIYDAASPGFPERLTLAATVDNVGTYVLSANLYENLFRVIGYGELSLPQGGFPITTTFDRKGILNPIKLVQEENDAFTTDTEDGANDGANEFRDLFKLEIQPGVFIISKIDGTLFANARKKNHIFNFPRHDRLIKIR